MGNIILVIVGLVLVAIGVICIFDARVITKKIFGFGDQNEGTMGLKIFGFLFAIAGAFVIFFNMWLKSMLGTHIACTLKYN